MASRKSLTTSLPSTGGLPTITAMAKPISEETGVCVAAPARRFITSVGHRNSASRSTSRQSSREQAAALQLGEQRAPHAIGLGGEQIAPHR